MLKRSIAVAACLAGLAGCSSESAGPGAGDLVNNDPNVAGPNAAGPSLNNGDTGQPNSNNTTTPTSNTGDGPEASPSHDPSQDPTPVVGNMPGDPADDPAAADCVGFEVVGLQYSPGGDVLPNTCKPFDSRTNNPYAIRCVDADPNYDTGFPGDEFCILPPPPELGTQVRVGPDSYDNPPPDFVMTPGQEFNDFYYVNAPNEEDHYFYRVNLRMRAGSHHMINRMLEQDRADGWNVTGDIGIGGSGSFPGAQRPDQDRPNGTLEVPPENAGLGQHLQAKQQFSFNLHHFNLTEGETLREVWVNIWYKPEEEITDQMGGISMFGNPLDLNIPPGEHRELEYRCDVTGNTRIITLNGHRHAWTDRFGVWIVRANGEVEDVYESFEYSDMPTYQYDTISQNPVPDVAMQKDGATTGMLEVSPGDKIHFVCDITNGGEQTLRFANEVLTGEMCILFGSYTGDALCRSGVRVQ